MIVAVTGIILILFVIGHLLGNLQIFIGPDWINGYSQHLRDLGPLLWAIRLFLLAAVIIHIWVTIHLAVENRRARPEAYVDRHYVKADFASRHISLSAVESLRGFCLLATRQFRLPSCLDSSSPLNNYDWHAGSENSTGPASSKMAQPS